MTQTPTGMTSSEPDWRRARPPIPGTVILSATNSYIYVPFLHSVGKALSFDALWQTRFPDWTNLASEMRGKPLPDVEEIILRLREAATQNTSPGEPYATHSAIARLKSVSRKRVSWEELIAGLSDSIGYIPAATQVTLLGTYGGS